MLVTSRYAKASKAWNGLMSAHHYLGAGPLCGAQLPYLVRSPIHVLLGGLSFSGATLRLKARDEWIGWSEGARRANLQRVVRNSRFLMAPSVRVPNLASHVLDLVLGRLCADWRDRYGYEPVLVETFVDGTRFAGACYRASNWRRLGQSAERADGFADGTRSTGSKEIFAYPLRRDWRSVLCREHAVVLAVQDTWHPNYTAHPTTEGLGPINTKQDSAIGLILRDTMAFSVERTPLGLLDVQCWARDPKEAGKRDKRKSLPISANRSPSRRKRASSGSTATAPWPRSRRSVPRPCW